MKKYLWLGVAVLFVHVNASGFSNIDKETDSFLSDLRSVIGLDEVEEDEEIKEIEVTAPEPGVSKTKETQSGIDQAIRKAAILEAKMAEEAKKAEALAAEKREEARIQKEKEEREAEQREVEAYEKKRAQKRAKEVKEQATLEKQRAAEEAVNQRVVTPEVPVNDVVVDINVTQEAKEAKAAADTAYQEAVQEMREAE